jgi:hypothetical protein
MILVGLSLCLSSKLQVDGEFLVTDLLLRVVASSAANGRAGLFERLQKNPIRYLIPETGELSEVLRRTVAVK